MGWGSARVWATSATSVFSTPSSRGRGMMRAGVAVLLEFVAALPLAGNGSSVSVNCANSTFFNVSVPSIPPSRWVIVVVLVSSPVVSISYFRLPSVSVYESENMATSSPHRSSLDLLMLEIG